MNTDEEAMNTDKAAINIDETATNIRLKKAHHAPVGA